jgi:hypothetical protein
MKQNVWRSTTKFLRGAINLKPHKTPGIIQFALFTTSNIDKESVRRRGTQRKWKFNKHTLAVPIFRGFLGLICHTTRVRRRFTCGSRVVRNVLLQS